MAHGMWHWHPKEDSDLRYGYRFRYTLYSKYTFVKIRIVSDSWLFLLYCIVLLRISIDVIRWYSFDIIWLFPTGLLCNHKAPKNTQSLTCFFNKKNSVSQGQKACCLIQSVSCRITNDWSCLDMDHLITWHGICNDVADSKCEFCLRIQNAWCPRWLRHSFSVPWTFWNARWILGLISCQNVSRRLSHIWPSTQWTSIRRWSWICPLDCRCWCDVQTGSHSPIVYQY